MPDTDFSVQIPWVAPSCSATEAGGVPASYRQVGQPLAYLERAVLK